MVYANLINDYMFKRVFGSDECKDILMDFLNGIVGGEEIVGVDILNSENLGIGITDFAISHEAGWPADRYRSSYSIREDSTGESLNGKLQFIFLELGRFSKPEEELETLADKWMYLFRHMARLQTRPVNFTPEQLKSCQNAEKMKYDFQNTVNYAEKKGREAGRADMDNPDLSPILIHLLHQVYR